MRLQILEEGHAPLKNLLFRFIASMSEGHVPGPIATMSYRRDFFGKYFAQCIQEAMRDAQEWSLGEVELFAAFVSQLNKCKY